MNFIFSHLNAFILGIWIILLILVSIRYFKAGWVRNISYLNLVVIAIAINLFYGIFVTWGQYYVWSISSDITKNLLTLPLPKEVPFPQYFEWARFIFEGNSGYFTFYIFGRIWLNIFISFFVSIVLYFIFKSWNNYRGGFSEEGPTLLLVLMLVSGFPGVLITISLGFIFSIFAFIFYYYLKRVEEVKIEPIFIFSALISLVFSNIILSYML